MNVLIEGAQRHRVGIITARIRRVAIPQRIVHSNEPAGANELQKLVVIRALARFVRLDECEIETCLRTRRQQLHQRLKPGLQALRAATPAARQNCRATAVVRGSMSQVTILASAGSASANARLE